MPAIIIIGFIIWIFVKTLQAEKESEWARQNSKKKGYKFYYDGYGQTRDTATGKKSSVWNYTPERHTGFKRVGGIVYSEQKDGTWKEIFRDRNFPNQ